MQQRVNNNNDISRSNEAPFSCIIVSRYFMGQLNEIATVFYKLENMSVKVLESINDDPGSPTSSLKLDARTVCVKYRLDFDNRDYVSFIVLTFTWVFNFGLPQV